MKETRTPLFALALLFLVSCIGMHQRTTVAIRNQTGRSLDQVSLELPSYSLGVGLLVSNAFAILYDAPWEKPTTAKILFIDRATRTAYSVDLAPEDFRTWKGGRPRRVNVTIFNPERAEVTCE